MKRAVFFLLFSMLFISCGTSGETDEDGYYYVGKFSDAGHYPEPIVKIGSPIENLCKGGDPKDYGFDVTIKREDLNSSIVINYANVEGTDYNKIDALKRDYEAFFF